MFPQVSGTVGVYGQLYLNIQIGVRMNEKTYQRLREELNDLEGYSPEQLDEIRILRGAAALTFAARAKQSGDKVVQHSRQGKEHLSKLKRQESIEDKIDVLSDALDEILTALFRQESR